MRSDPGSRTRAAGRPGYHPRAARDRAVAAHRRAPHRGVHGAVAPRGRKLAGRGSWARLGAYRARLGIELPARLRADDPVGRYASRALKGLDGPLGQRPKIPSAAPGLNPSAASRFCSSVTADPFEPRRRTGWLLGAVCGGRGAELPGDDPPHHEPSVSQDDSSDSSPSHSVSGAVVPAAWSPLSGGGAVLPLLARSNAYRVLRADDTIDGESFTLLEAANGAPRRRIHDARPLGAAA